MAGIGFSLQRMAEGRSLTGQAGAYVYAVFLVAGPWIFMALAIAGMSGLTCPDNQCASVQEFRSIAIYNFCFSLVITGAISLPVTRYISDQIYAKRNSDILGAFIFALALFGVLALIFVLPFYLFLGDLSAAQRWAAFQNVLLAGAAWLIVPFLGTLKDYRGVSLAFMAGAAVMLAAVAMNREEAQQTLFMLNAFNLGLGVINGGLAFCVVREFGLEVKIDRELFRVFTRYWELAAIGAAHYAGIWIDKIIMWQVADNGALTIAGVFRTMPDYDAVMFWAQLTTIPILVVFFVHVEPNFYRLYRRFYGSFARYSSKREIEERMAALTTFVVRNVIGIFGAMVVVTAGAILFSFIAIEMVGLRPNQMGMLRAALLGVGFHTSALFCQIFLLYFDLRRYALAITVLYAALNGALTLALLPLGFAYYGFGQMLAAALMFLAAFNILVRELPWLHFHAFVTNNRSINPAR